jgi:thiol-disulfide isomerase/thioredoxin
MKKFIALSSALLSVLTLSSCASGGLSKANENAFVSGSGVAVYIKPELRKTAPELLGPTLSGTALKIAKNQVVVVNVWASWCSPCRAEAPLLADFANRLAGKVQFVGIVTRDNISAAAAFVNRFKIPYPNFIDDSLLADFRGSLLPNAIPTTLIIDANNRVAVRISGEVTYALLDSMINRVIAQPSHA